ncbi:MAG: hypothetical protein ABR978_01600 [Dehalococcoidia bacterium]
MRRWFWALLTLSGVALAVAFAVFPFAGHNNVRTYAHIVDLDGDTVVTGPGDAHLEIDMNPTNGSGPCNPVDDTANVTVGQTYSVAVCLTSAGRIGDVGNEPNAFNFNLVYDDSLNQCQPVTCGAGTSDPSCYDGNPDANMGVTSFSTPDLGGAAVGYDCTGVGKALPVCDKNAGAHGPGLGVAYIGCFTTGTPTLPVGDTVSAPLAMVTFHVIAGGVDTMSLTAVVVTSSNYGASLVACPGGIGECFGGTDNKTGGGTATAGPTATSTTVPTATGTPSCGLEGLPTCTATPKAYTSTPTAVATATAVPSGGGGGGGGGNPPLPPPPGGGAGPAVSPPSTGDGSGGTSWATWLIGVMASFGAISLVSGGLYLRRARMRQ